MPAIGNNLLLVRVIADMKTPLCNLILSAVVLSAVALAAAAKPNFCGDWELSVARSDLGGVPITKLVVHVDHKDPVFKYSANGTADGQDFEESETFSTDGTPSHDSRGATVKARWDGMSLIIESTGADGKALDRTRLTLSADGKNITREYERTSPGDEQKRHEIYDKR